MSLVTSFRNILIIFQKKLKKIFLQGVHSKSSQIQYPSEDTLSLDFDDYLLFSLLLYFSGD